MLLTRRDTDMERAGYHRGLSLLWINLAVAIAVLVQVSGNQLWRAPELAHIIGYSLIYANLCGLLAVLLVRTAARKPILRRLPLAPLVAVAIVVSAIIGCLLAQMLILKLNMATPADFWSEYGRILRIAIPLGLVFGSGALAHASLRARVHDFEAKLRDKEVSEERTRKLPADRRLYDGLRSICIAGICRERRRLSAEACRAGMPRPRARESRAAATFRRRRAVGIPKGGQAAGGFAAGQPA
jgi:hypothetical protein